MPAVANAVFDALGVRVDQCPITPELVLKALASPTKRSGPAKYPDLKITDADTMRVKTPDEGGDGDAEGEWASKKTKKERAKS